MKLLCFGIPLDLTGVFPFLSSILQLLVQICGRDLLRVFDGNFPPTLDACSFMSFTIDLYFTVIYANKNTIRSLLSEFILFRLYVSGFSYDTHQGVKSFYFIQNPHSVKNSVLRTFIVN